jgi:hypothetical protein
MGSGKEKGYEDRVVKKKREITKLEKILTTHISDKRFFVKYVNNSNNNKRSN